MGSIPAVPTIHKLMLVYWYAHRTVAPEVLGSIPARQPTLTGSSTAERLTLDQEVPGSNPGW